ncbi:MAG: radical SAM protein, partial [Planctomycetota bacterium]
MARLEEKDYTYFTTVRGMCRGCRRIVPARVFFRDGGVWQESLCPDCESAPALIAADRDWYLTEVLRRMPDRSPLRDAREPVNGCPHDCGPCTWHASRCQLPVFSVTNVCDMSCPICFTYNRSDRPYHMPLDEVSRVVDWIVESSGPVDLVNITGGEPTCHPEIVEVLKRCRRDEIGRVTVNSNGLRFSREYDLCERIAETGAHVILSFNALDGETSIALHGRDVVEAKLKAIDNLTRAGVKLTLLNVMVRGVNEDVAGRILKLMRENASILSLTVQTMTYTGQGGGRYGDRRHIPVDEAARKVCSHSGGTLEFSDFIARPSAHPLCYLTSYLLHQGEELVPFTRFAEAERISDLMKDSYVARLEGEHDFFRDAINR